MANDNTKIPSGLSLDDTLAALAYATSLQEKLFMAKNPQEEPVEASESPQDAPEQEIAEKPMEAPKAEKLPEDNDFQEKVLDELASLKAEVESLLKEEDAEDEEEVNEDNNSNDTRKEEQA